MNSAARLPTLLVASPNVTFLEVVGIASARLFAKTRPLYKLLKAVASPLNISDSFASSTPMNSAARLPTLLVASPNVTSLEVVGIASARLFAKMRA